MTIATGTYDSTAAQSINLSDLLNRYQKLGITNVYIKKLSPNDNSKNQPYLGSHLTDLSFLPIGKIEGSNSTSNRKGSKKRKIKYQAPISFKWVDPAGGAYAAPHAKLVYYPQYPEVRFSGFLLGSKANLSEWMAPGKSGRAEGRWLVLGVSSDETIFGYLVTPDCRLSTELNNTATIPTASVFNQIANFVPSTSLSTQQALLTKLLQIHSLGWVQGRRLDKNGILKNYNARNGGGYTLESLLGIIPNSQAEPDYLGWEVKQYGVKIFPGPAKNPTTLMTPEPDGGYYSMNGLSQFIRKYGYPAKNKTADRLNFSSPHYVGKQNTTTNLKLVLTGFDKQNNKITNANGAIVLLDNQGNHAASWSFPKLLNHWKRKHSKAVFVPCMMKIDSSKNRHYKFGGTVQLGIGTDFELLLGSLVTQLTYYDPGCKLERASTPKAKAHPRNQLRIRHKGLADLYHRFLQISL